MSYSVFILRRAQKELAQLSSEAYERVRDVIRTLAKDPRPAGCLKLIGRNGWRIRIGDYREASEFGKFRWCKERFGEEKRFSSPRGDSGKMRRVGAFWSAIGAIAPMDKIATKSHIL
ncbi:MAG: type II toxin-antitoxin system RelE/ParE family toxin [Candidatus Edwardsbacteria bacterium]